MTLREQARRTRERPVGVMRVHRVPTAVDRAASLSRRPGLKAWGGSRVSLRLAARRMAHPSVMIGPSVTPGAYEGVCHGAHDAERQDVRPTPGGTHGAYLELSEMLRRHLRGEATARDNESILVVHPDDPGTTIELSFRGDLLWSAAVWI